MRGAMPDAECPRCGETSPPPESKLATCARCGLVFPPHEIEHRPPGPPPLPEPPAHVTAVRRADRIVVRWPLARWSSSFAIAAGLAAGWFMGVAVFLRMWWLAAPLAAAIGVAAYLAVVALVSSHEVVIEREAVRYRIAPVPFGARRVVSRRGMNAAEVTAVPARIDGLFAVQLRRASGTAERLFTSRDRAVLSYVGGLVASQLAVPLGLPEG